jgi:serine protease AprX
VGEDSVDRLVKIFCAGRVQDRVAEAHRVIERYDGFVLAQVPKASIGGLSQQYPVEDITEQYAIRAGDQVLDTSRPRLDAKGKVHAHPAYRRAKPLSRGPHHHLVQFVGPIKAEWLTAVKRAGGEPREPYQDFTYVVRADEAALGRIAGLPFVRWVGHLSHMDRVAPSVLERAGRKPSDPSAALSRTRVIPGAYTVEFFGSRDLTAGLPAVKRLGCKVVGKDARAKVLVVETTGSERERRRQIEALAAVHGVRSIRERALKRTSNDVAAGIMHASVAMGNQGLGLSGKGELVGICDTGLDTGNAATMHPDFAGRIAWIKSYPITPDLSPYVSNPGGDDGPADLDSGHGTHVAGSALGSGSASAGLPGLNGPIRGLAYNALLAFQAVEQEMQWKNPAHFTLYGRYILAGIPLDLAALFSYAYGRRVRIHSNSWGGGDPGAYDAQCEQLDRFVWEHKTFTVLVAAGNDGTDSDGDGKINSMSVTSPATAKNCITVGACENHRPTFNAQTYGGWWPQDYPVAPFRNDPMANDPDQVAAFSSRGPTEDGRIKPDVVGPGTFILSTRSTQIAQNNMAWAGFPPSKLYFHMGGTSMATPLVAGAAALVREYLRKQKKIARPTAALLKAALIAGATRLSGYAPAGAVLDHHQGFGRVDLDAALSPPKPASTTFRQVRPGLRTGEVRNFAVKVKSGAVPFRVVLAYSDYPGPSLVNNLNLLVTAPNGTQYAGNRAPTGGMAFDAKNNVEVVHVQKPDAGTWKIAVVASNVPQGPQDFALVSIAHVQT